MSETEALAPEWSHLFDVTALEDGPAEVEISPDEDASKALLKRLGIDGIKDAKAQFSIHKHAASVEVRGHVVAIVVQPCVVTLDPVETQIEDSFDAWYADPDGAVPISKARRARDSKKGQTELPMLEEHEDPEPLVDGKIDLGELATQYISLSINPFVHAPGVEYEHGDDAPGASKSQTRENPFAVLKDWKDKLK